MGSDNVYLEFATWHYYDLGFTLPKNLTSISSQAFSGLSQEFYIVVTDKVTYIADDAFEGSKVLIIAPMNSYAIEWAQKHDFPYSIR